MSTFTDIVNFVRDTVQRLVNRILGRETRECPDLDDDPDDASPDNDEAS